MIRLKIYSRNEGVSFKKQKFVSQQDTPQQSQQYTKKSQEFENTVFKRT